MNRYSIKLAAILMGAFPGLLLAEDPMLKSFEIRMLGQRTQTETEPLAKVEVVFTRGYGSEQKKSASFLTNGSGIANVKLAPGFYHIELDCVHELPYLPVEVFWNGRTRGPRPCLSLNVTETEVMKFLEGNPRPEGVGPSDNTGRLPRVTYTMLPGCELVLRAVDADTGKGLAGAMLYEENAVGEDWAHDIPGQNIGWKLPRNDKEQRARIQTDNQGYFRRYIGANNGYLYGYVTAPTGYDASERYRDHEIKVVFGQRKAEHIFKFRPLAKTE